MIIKDFQLEKIVHENKGFFGLLVYGPNEGLVKEQIDRVLNDLLSKDEFEKIILQGKSLDNEPLALDEIVKTVSMFHNKKVVIVDSLKEDSSKWCKEQLKILEKKSPTSMGVATRQLDISKSLNLKDCLSMEFRICQAMMNRHDFYEGVRANLVDKDRDPKWKPITVDLLEEKLIDDHFKNLEEKELF